MVRSLRSSVVLSLGLLVAFAALPESAEAQSHRHSHRVSRVRGHRHGTTRLHRGYVQGHLGHRDHPSTYYPSYSPRYRHYSGRKYSRRNYNDYGACAPGYGERHSYSYSERHGYGSGYGHYSGYSHGETYTSGYSSACSPGYSSGYGYGYSSNGYGYYSTYGSHVSYAPWGATVYGRRNGRSAVRAVAAYGNRHWLRGPATYLNTKRATPWRAHIENAIDEGLYDTGESPAGEDASLEGSDVEKDTPLEDVDGRYHKLDDSPEDHRDADSTPAASDSSPERGRIDFRDQDGKKGSDASRRRPSADQDDRGRAKRLQHLLTRVSVGQPTRGLKSATSTSSPTKRGRIAFSVLGK